MIFAGNVASADYDVAAYVWPAYQPELRWAELGIFNDGKGEWQNVYEAKPKWEGHRQPLVPLWGYENEADPKVVEKKIDAAVSHGVNVFIYDWYWYGGRPFLEDARDKGLLGAKNNGKRKFFVMWANHNVVKLWDKPIWPAAVSEAEFKVLTRRWIDRYFTRPNYYRIDGKPVLMIYELKTFIDGVGGREAAKRSLDYLREECVKAGLGGAYIMVCDYALSASDLDGLGIDGATIYNLVHWNMIEEHEEYGVWAEKAQRRFATAKDDLGVRDYFAHASVGWDANSRYPANSIQPTATNATPRKFEVVLRRAKDWTDCNTRPGAPKLITVNSWNEWTEGSYLEPEAELGFAYLEVIRKVFCPESMNR